MIFEDLVDDADWRQRIQDFEDAYRDQWLDVPQESYTEEPYESPNDDVPEHRSI